MFENKIPYEVGDVIVYRAFGGDLRTVQVTACVEQDGQPVFDAHVVDEPARTVWGYADQIVENLGKVN